MGIIQFRNVVTGAVIGTAVASVAYVLTGQEHGT